MTRTKRESEDDVKVKDVELVGDRAIEDNDITPSTYFDYVKGLKQKFDKNEYDLIIDTTLTMLKKTKITGQTAMAKELTHQLDLALRELNAANNGFEIFVNRKDIEKYIGSVEGKAVKLIELKNYEREIPDNIIDKIEKAQEIFDNMYIIFTDYTKKETKKVAKQRRDKDPILFGAFTVKDESNIYVEDRLFFIADWVEEKCDLTLEQIVRDIKDKTSKDITYKVSNPKDEEEVKKMLKSYKEPIDNLTPVSIFSKIKEKIVKKTSSKPRKKKQVEEV